MSDSSVSSCGPAHMKAMVSESQCTTVFGCRLAGPDEFKPAKKTCEPKRFCDSYSLSFSNTLEALDELDRAPKAQAVAALCSRANNVLCVGQSSATESGDSMCGEDSRERE